MSGTPIQSLNNNSNISYTNMMSNFRSPDLKYNEASNPTPSNTPSNAAMNNSNNRLHYQYPTDSNSRTGPASIQPISGTSRDPQSIPNHNYEPNSAASKAATSASSSMIKLMMERGTAFDGNMPNIGASKSQSSPGTGPLPYTSSGTSNTIKNQQGQYNPSSYTTSQTIPTTNTSSISERYDTIISNAPNYDSNMYSNRFENQSLDTSRGAYERSMAEVTLQSYGNPSESQRQLPVSLDQQQIPTTQRRPSLGRYLPSNGHPTAQYGTQQSSSQSHHESAGAWFPNGGQITNTNNGTSIPNSSSTNGTWNSNIQSSGGITGSNLSNTGKVNLDTNNRPWGNQFAE
jgi:hypothetical protein